MYESDLNAYANSEHEWFDPKDAISSRGMVGMSARSSCTISGN